MSSSPCVLFDAGPLGTGSLFEAPRDIIEAWTPDELPGAFDRLRDAQAAGQWLAGMCSYELGYALTPRLRPLLPTARDTPLLRFGAFGSVSQPGATWNEPQPATGTLSPLTPEWGFDTYAEAFARVRAHLEAGDIYQANLTMALTGQASGDLRALYADLRDRQPVPHGAYVDLGGAVLLSRSPELFFSLSDKGVLRTRPMKGTLPRGRDAAEDAQLRDRLFTSEKNRAENLMITDLLRNDFGRIAEIGSVRVPKLFEIESYATVHQMISEVTAQLRSNLSLEDLLTAVFPCGSITGAPKIRAMEILAGLEPAPRGAYCGAIGWIAPSGAMAFNVAIRTLICQPSGQVTLNVGGGLVHDSTARGEYDEALLKARFAQPAATAHPRPLRRA